jgi:hypothetical protein
MKANDAAHYVLVYGALLISWVPLMNHFNGDVAYTAAAGLVVFVVADKIAHKLLKV